MQRISDRFVTVFNARKLRIRLNFFLQCIKNYHLRIPFRIYRKQLKLSRKINVIFYFRFTPDNTAHKSFDQSSYYQQHQTVSYWNYWSKLKVFLVPVVNDYFHTSTQKTELLSVSFAIKKLPSKLLCSVAFFLQEVIKLSFHHSELVFTVLQKVWSVADKNCLVFPFWKDVPWFFR